MEEVSARIFAFYSEAVSRRDIAREVLTEGLPSLERLLQGASWYDWSDHVRMLERFQTAMGGMAGADQAALEANERRVAERLRVLARSLADVKLLYRAGFWFGSSLYRHVNFSVRSEGHLLRVTITLPERYEGSAIFFRMWRGTLRGMPRMLGLPDATVTSELTSHRGEFKVLVPEGRDVISRARRVVDVARTSAVLLTHLEKHEQELRAAYDALLRSRQDFREIAQNTPDALMLIRGGVTVYANPAAAAAIPGQRLADAVHEDDQPIVTGWLREAEERGSAGRLDFRAGARTFEAEAAHAVDFSGNGAILVLARDVSDRQAAEERIRRSEQDKRGLLEAIPDLIVRTTAEGVIVGVAGQASHSIAGILRDRIGKPLRTLAEELEQLPDDFAEALVAGASAARPEAFVLETSAWLSQERLHLEWRSVAIEGGDTVSLVRDLSHERHMEAELAVTERLASLGMLAAGVGHEINNPLAYLLLQLGLLEKAIANGESPSGLSKHVASALEGASHIERVVRSLKALAQRVPEHNHPVDVNAVIEEILRLTENRMPPGTTLHRDFQPSVFALADEGPLGQIVGNLFINAMDAVRATGAPGEIRVSTCTRREGVEISISDTGVGMSPEAIKRAFDPFFTTKSLTAGMGLGLTLTHRMVTALGGTISIDSESGSAGPLGPRCPERGTSVTVRLAEGGPPRRKATPAARVAPRFDGASVLVIDDQPNLVTTLRMLLDDCVVTSASCGQDGLAALLRQSFDVVLCDIVMPDLDGVGIFVELERRAPEVLPRVVFMTGGAILPEIEDFLARIPNACLQKPFSEEQLRLVMGSRMRAAPVLGSAQHE